MGARNAKAREISRRHLTSTTLAGVSPKGAMQNQTSVLEGRYGDTGSANHGRVLRRQWEVSLAASGVWEGGPDASRQRGMFIGPQVDVPVCFQHESGELLLGIGPPGG